MSNYQKVRVAERATVLMGQSPPSSACSESGNGLPFIQGNAEFGVRHPLPRLRCSAPTRIAENGDLLLSVRAQVGELNQATARTVIGRGLSALRFALDDQGFAWHALKWSAGTLNQIAQGSTFVAVTRQDVEDLEIPWHGDANQHIALVRPGPRIVSRWLGRFLAHGPSARQFQMLNDSGAKAGLNLPAVESLLVAVPSREEQGAASHALDAIDFNVSEEQAFADKLRRIKSGLMTDLLTGRVRVPETLDLAEKHI